MLSIQNSRLLRYARNDMSLRHRECEAGDRVFDRFLLPIVTYIHSEDREAKASEIGTTRMSENILSPAPLTTK